MRRAIDKKLRRNAIRHHNVNRRTFNWPAFWGAVTAALTVVGFVFFYTTSLGDRIARADAEFTQRQDQAKVEFTQRQDRANERIDDTIQLILDERRSFIEQLDRILDELRELRAQDLKADEGSDTSE